MATFTPSAVISEIRGRVGSSIWSKNVYGVYVKNSYAPTNPNTALQQTARANFNNAQAAWNAFSDAQRLAWAQKAKRHPVQDRLGQTKILTPKMFYISRYLPLARIGTTPIPFPINDQREAIITASLSASASGSIQLSWTSTDSTGNWEIMLSVSAPLSPTINKPARGRLAFLQSILTFGTSPADITSNYTARHGSIAGLAGQKIFGIVKAVRIGTGQTTVEQPFSTIITA